MYPFYDAIQYTYTYTYTYNRYIYIIILTLIFEVPLIEKVKLQAWVNQSLDTKFRELINQKYKKYEKGLLSYEVEMALRHWLSLHTNAQSEINPQHLPNPTPKVQLIFAQIKDFLLKDLYYEIIPGQQIPVIHLRRAIENIRGSDPRTVKKWLKVFHKNGLVKPVTSATWEVM